MEKKLQGIDYLKEIIKSNYDEQDRLLFHKEQLNSYYTSTKSKLEELMKEIRKVETILSLITKEIKLLNNTKKARQSEPEMSLEHTFEFTPDPEREAEELDWYLNQEEFTSGFEYGLDIFISDNIERQQFYENLLSELNNRRIFLEKRKRKIEECFSSIQVAETANILKGCLKTLKTPRLLINDLNNRSIPKERPKIKKK